VKITQILAIFLLCGPLFLSKKSWSMPRSLQQLVNYLEEVQEKSFAVYGTTFEFHITTDPYPENYHNMDFLCRYSSPEELVSLFAEKMDPFSDLVEDNQQSLLALERLLMERAYEHTLCRSDQGQGNAVQFSNGYWQFLFIF
jgi:hypothetical protein